MTETLFTWTEWDSKSRGHHSYQARRVLDLLSDMLEPFACDPCFDHDANPPDAWATLSDGRIAFRVDLSNGEHSIIVIPTIDEDGSPDGRSKCVRVEILRGVAP